MNSHAVQINLVAKNQRVIKAISHVHRKLHECEPQEHQQYSYEFEASPL